MALTHRVERIQEQVREEVSQMLATEVRDPGVGLVTVTRTKVTGDLSLARVPRATGDIDVLVNPSPDNAQRVLRALDRFGAPLFDLRAADLARGGTVFQLGLPPRRIDLLTSIDGVSFADAWPRRVMCRIDDQEVPVLSREDLVANKRAAGRPKDLVDVQILEQEGNGPRVRRKPKR